MREDNTQYNGQERRDGYCPVHKLKCEEWRATEESMKSKVPIWVFRIFLTLLVAVLGAMNCNAYRHNEVVLATVQDHVETSTSFLRRVSHGLREVASNQRTVMKELNLEFEHMPDYETD